MRALFGEDFEVRQLERTDVTQSEGWASRGVQSFHEVVYLMQRRP